MDEQPKRYPHLPPEEEARLRGVPVSIIKIERDVNARLNQPELLRLLSDLLNSGEADFDTPAAASSPPPRSE